MEDRVAARAARKVVGRSMDVVEDVTVLSVCGSKR